MGDTGCASFILLKYQCINCSFLSGHSYIICIYTGAYYLQKDARLGGAVARSYHCILYAAYI